MKIVNVPSGVDSLKFDKQEIIQKDGYAIADVLLHSLTFKFYVSPLSSPSAPEKKETEKHQIWIMLLLSESLTSNF